MVHMKLKDWLIWMDFISIVLVSDTPSYAHNSTWICERYCEYDISLHRLKNNVDESHSKLLTALKQPQQDFRI